jgi:hypothetical protein
MDGDPRARQRLRTGCVVGGDAAHDDEKVAGEDIIIMPCKMLGDKVFRAYLT